MEAKSGNDQTIEVEDDTAPLLQDTSATQEHKSTQYHQHEQKAYHSNSLRLQYLVTFVAVLGAMTMGTSLGWSGPALVHLNHTLFPDETNADFEITPNETSWIGSLLPIGALVGGICGGFLLSKYGRKAAMYLATVLFGVGYCIILLAQDALGLYIGRLFCGFASGLTTVSCPTYIAEIASPQIRGMLGSSFQVMITIGIMYVNVVGTFCSWRLITVACLVIDVIWFISLLFIPETPLYLLTEKNYDAARASLQFLRGHRNVEKELEEIENMAVDSNRRRASYKDLGKTQNLKPLLISILIMFGQQFSGINAIMFYGVSIFEAAHTNLNSFVQSIIVSVMQVTTTIVSSLIVDKFGRRRLLILSGVIMTLSISCLGSYFYIQEKEGNDIAEKISFLPLPSLCVYMIAFSIGFGPIPWLMMPELMAVEVKSMSSSIAATSNWAMAFIVSQFYPRLAEEVGKSYTFWGFAVLLIISLVLIIRFAPETKGKSLEEIQQLFRSNDKTIITDEENPK